MAERYGMLPSEVIQRANTFDLVVLTAAVSYRNEQYEKAVDPDYKPKTKQLSQEEMLAMITRVRNKQENKK